ncbi:MAG: STAS domain-containing protein [Myxococcales bacterium]|jgi:anti-anti-sigma factor
MMETKVEKLGSGWTVLSVVGRVDGHTAPELETVCRAQVAAGAIKLALDITAVTFMSSAGLRVLLATRKSLASKAGEMAVVGAQPNVRQVLDISGFTAILRLESSRAALV